MKQTKKTPKISQYETFAKTPFTVQLEERAFVKKAEHELVRNDAGDEFAMYKIEKNKRVVHDPKSYIKLYKGNAEILKDLKDAAAKLFYYICEQLKPNSETVCIIMEDFFKFANYEASGRINYYKAIEGLLQACVIARVAGSTTCFFINPDIIFNGDRTKFSNVKMMRHAEGEMNSANILAGITKEQE